MNFNNRVNVDTYYDTYFLKRMTSNKGEYLTDALDLEILIKFWLNQFCKGQYEYVTEEATQLLCFELIDDYTRFCLTWC